MSARTTNGLEPPVLVASAEGLALLLDKASRASDIGVDTESNSLFAYYHQICLLQLSLPDQDFLVDTLACDVRPLGALFSDPGCQKIFHAAENDILGLNRDFGFTFANLFDTMLAARILGWSAIGLAAILDERFDVQSDKRLQRTNWGQRPLDPIQMAYAQLDSHFLLSLRDQQAAELQARGRWQEAQESFEQLTELRWTEKHFDPDGFWQINGARDLSGTEQAVLRELFLYREEQAQKLDRPPFKVLGNNTLIAISRQRPGGMRALQRIRGMTPGQTRRYGKGILAAVARGKQAPAPKVPQRRRTGNGRPDPETRARYEALRHWRTRRAKQRGVDPDIVLANEALMTIARQAPTTPEALAATKVMGPWKLQEYGDAILQVLAGT